MKFWLWFLLLSSSFAYTDPELEELWVSISSYTMPTIEDYQRIEIYLSQGKRPYLDLLRKSSMELPEFWQGTCHWRLSLMQGFQLIGSNGELPVFEIHKLGNEKRCILIFASYNRNYANKARQLLEEIKDCGYQGDVLLRIGGFPDLPNGGLKLCYIPYAFKVAFLSEARSLGYEEVLWLDTAMHPLTDLSEIFDLIEGKGVYFTTVGSLKENHPLHLKETSEYMGVAYELHDQIPHIASAIIGLDFQNPEANRFLNRWLEETKKVYPNLNWFPEELCLSIVAWELGCSPHSWLGSITCNENEVFELFQLNQRPGLQFYLDGRR